MSSQDELKDAIKGTVERNQTSATEAMRRDILEVYGHEKAIQAILVDVMSHQEGGALKSIGLRSNEQAAYIIDHLAAARDQFEAVRRSVQE